MSGQRGRYLRWGLLAWVALLIASHLFRWLRPFTPSPDRDEQVIAVSEVSGSTTSPQPVLIATIDSGVAESDRLPVVLLHGSPGDNGEVRALAGNLSHTRRVLAPDLPGYGASTRRIRDYSILAHAAYVEQLLDSLGIRRYHVVGFSLGGGVAAHLAHRRPERVASLTLLSSLGVQEFELLGDHLLNHGLHSAQLLGLTLLREAVPHFGALDDGSVGVEFARNLHDTDQRPLRSILEQWPGPTLIIQGDHDQRVPPSIAIEHGRILPQSEVHLIPGDHFMVSARADELAGLIGSFILRAETGRAATRSTADPERVVRSTRAFDPGEAPSPVGFAFTLVLLLLILATLVSGDLACVAAGLLVARGTLGFWPAVGACMVGIVSGDILFFLLGRWVGPPVLRLVPLRWFVNEGDVTRSSRWFARRGMWIVLASRFMPGTRVPTYVAAGMLRTRLASFLLAFLVASAFWVPVLVGASAIFGGQLLDWFSRHGRLDGGAFLAALALLYFAVEVATRLATWRGRRLLLSRWRRLSRWEFWPPWILNAPAALYVLWLGLRYRSPTLFTCANPAIPGGGLAGESKHATLEALGTGNGVAPSVLLEAGSPLHERMDRLSTLVHRHRLDWPIVLKPDTGERGLGVHFPADADAARDYLERADFNVVAQPLVGGAEFRVLYYRMPGEEAGHIVAITEKHLPEVTGDGGLTLEQLILSDDWAVSSARLFLRLHAGRLDWVPFLGQKVALTLLGTHTRGAIFHDGARLITPALEASMDRVSRGYRGFHVGSFDLRAPSADALMEGGPFTVLELEGVSSEALPVHDGRRGLLHVYRTLFAQWELAFEIGRRNRDAGARPATGAELLALLRKHRRATRAAQAAELAAPVS